MLSSRLPLTTPRPGFPVSGRLQSGPNLCHPYQSNTSRRGRLKKNDSSGYHPITTALLEGLGNEIEVLEREAYGYRDAAFFAPRLLFIHELRMPLVGC